MKTCGIGLLIGVGVLGFVTGMAPVPQDSEKAPLTAKDNGTKMTVRAGDSVQFKLPADTRNNWLWVPLGEEGSSVLGKPKVKYHTSEASRLATFDASYPIKNAPSQDKVVRWIYCQNGNTRNVAVGAKIRDHQHPTEGMIFEVSLTPPQ